MAELPAFGQTKGEIDLIAMRLLGSMSGESTLRADFFDYIAYGDALELINAPRGSVRFGENDIDDRRS